MIQTEDPFTRQSMEEFLLFSESITYTWLVSHPNIPIQRSSPSRIKSPNPVKFNPPCTSSKSLSLSASAVSGAQVPQPI